MTDSLPLLLLPACAQCGHTGQGTRAKAGNSVRCKGCRVMRRVPVGRPVAGPDDPRAGRPMRGDPFTGPDDPRRGPGVPRPGQLNPDGRPRPAKPQNVPSRGRPAPAPQSPFTGRGSVRRDPVAHIPNTPEEDLDEYPGTEETIRRFTERFQTDRKKRPAPSPAPRTEPPGVFIAPATNQVMASDSPLEFSLPPVYMACSECAATHQKNEKGIYNQAGIYIRVWDAATGNLVAESNMCRIHYREFIRHAGTHPEYRYRYSRDLRPGI